MTVYQNLLHTQGQALASDYEELKKQYTVLDNGVKEFVTQTAQHFKIVQTRYDEVVYKCQTQEQELTNFRKKEAQASASSEDEIRQLRLKNEQQAKTLRG